MRVREDALTCSSHWWAFTATCVPRGLVRTRTSPGTAPSGLNTDTQTVQTTARHSRHLWNSFQLVAVPIRLPVRWVGSSHKLLTGWNQRSQCPQVSLEEQQQPEAQYSLPGYTLDTHWIQTAQVGARQGGRHLSQSGDTWAIKYLLSEAAGGRSTSSLTEQLHYWKMLTNTLI